MAEEARDGWKIDKRIPVPMLLAILAQTMAIVIWGTHLDDRVVMLERTSVTTEQYAHVDEKMNTVKDNMSTMKDDVSSLRKDVQDIKDDIRRLAVRGKP
jgi:hypothetical protein